MEDKSKLPVVCKKSCSIKDKCSNPVYKQYEAKWIEAKELSKDDFILYPRVKEQIKEIKYDLLDYCEKEKHLRYDESNTYGMKLEPMV